MSEAEKRPTEVPAEDIEFVAELFAELELTPKQQIFLAALPKNNWQPWATVEKLGFGRASLHRWLQEDKFIKARDALNKHFLEAAGTSYQRTVMELTRVAYADPRKAFREGGDDLLPPSEMDDDVAAAVQSIEVTRVRRSSKDGTDEERETKNIQFAPKLAALQTLLKVNGQLVDRHEHTGADGAPLGFGVMVVPGVVSEAAWQSSATEQQKDLAEREQRASTGAGTSNSAS